MALHRQKTPKYDIHLWDGTNAEALVAKIGVAWTYQTPVGQVVDGALVVTSPPGNYFNRTFQPGEYVIFGPYWTDEVAEGCPVQPLNPTRYADEFEPVTEA